MRLFRLLPLPIAMLAAVGCASTPAHASPPPAQITVDVFVDVLAPYGEWIVVARHGRVWRPLAVAPGWQPYLHGEWVWTEDGWFWLTDEPWGWATYHYGRWAFEPGLGWIWVPGVVWAPAWVAWRIGDGFVGWAPLYPGFDVWWVDAYPIVPSHWVFVPTHRFVGTRVNVAALPRVRAPELLQASRPAPPGRERAAGPPLGGPAPRIVEERAGRRIAPARIVAVPTPAQARGRAGRGAVPVFRPAPSPARARGPGAGGPGATGSPAPPAPARPAPQRAGSGATPSPSSPEDVGPPRAPERPPDRAAPQAPPDQPPRPARPRSREDAPDEAPAPRPAPPGRGRTTRSLGRPRPSAPPPGPDGAHESTEGRP